MSSVYVDTSALGRVLLEEPDKLAIKDALDTFEQVIASHLLRVELRLQADATPAPRFIICVQRLDGYRIEIVEQA